MTYGGWQWVEKSLRALLENTGPCYELIVVDNASPDGLADRLEEEVGNIRLVRNRVSRSFGPAHNQAGTSPPGVPSSS